MISRTLQYATFAITAVALVAYFLAFGRIGGISGVVRFFPFTMIPFIVTVYFAARWRAMWGQAVLLATTLAYAAWFVYIYMQAMILHLDPQSPIAFLFVAIYALPVLILLWILAWALDWESSGTAS